VVRHPGLKRRGVVSAAMVSWVDLTPTVLDFAGALPKGHKFHGRSFLNALGKEKVDGRDEVYASHTFHEIQMYYPMRVIRTRKYKLIWNIASALPFPFASDLWAAPTWQDVYRRGPDALYGKRTVRAYIHRPAFELYDLGSDPHEVHNLAGKEGHAKVLEELKQKLKKFQKETGDPWVSKWEYE
jgi:N-sulfoglucosamine sulfohydrolase